MVELSREMRMPKRDADPEQKPPALQNLLNVASHTSRIVRNTLKSRNLVFLDRGCSISCPCRGCATVFGGDADLLARGDVLGKLAGVAFPTLEVSDPA